MDSVWRTDNRHLQRDPLPFAAVALGNQCWGMVNIRMNGVAVAREAGQVAVDTGQNRSEVSGEPGCRRILHRETIWARWDLYSGRCREFPWETASQTFPWEWETPASRLCPLYSLVLNLNVVWVHVWGSKAFRAQNPLGSRFLSRLRGGVHCVVSTLN